MKYIKTYESIYRPIKDGDYAMIIWNIRGEIQRHIVEIKKIIRDGRDKGDMLVRKLDDDTKNYLINPEQILYWSESKEELEVLNDSEKYNL